MTRRRKSENAESDRVTALHRIVRGRSSSRISELCDLLDGLDAGGVQSLRRGYIARYGRDPEFDLRGFGLGQSRGPLAARAMGEAHRDLLTARRC